MIMGLYEMDFAVWLNEQATALRDRNSNKLDWDNLVAEIESVGQDLLQQVFNQLVSICEILLKRQYLGEASVAALWLARRELDHLMINSPSLWIYAKDILAETYESACQNVAITDRIVHTPTDCPWTLEEVLDEGTRSARLLGPVEQT